MARILHMADLHFGTESDALAEALIARCAELDPHVVVAAGDLTQFGRRREFEKARAFFERLDAPVVASPGNHDTPYANLFSRLVTPWGRFAKRMGQSVVPRFRDPEVAVETFETARGLQIRLDWSLGRARPDQAREIASRLASEAGPDAARVVACHHPLVAPGGSTGRARTTYAEEAADIFARGGADLVLTGHLHQVFALKESRDAHACWFVGASTALSARTRDEPAGFNVIDIAEDAFTMTVYAADGEDFAVSDERRLERTP